jgi:VIT1/CCC1 family predicted Fe2+/Mn2+ transporter
MAGGLGIWAAKRGAEWWLKNRPLSPDKRKFRKERRQVRKENRRRKKEGLDLLEEPTMNTGLRTSTNTVIAGIVTYVLTFVVGLVPALSFLADPQVQIGIVGFVGWLIARLSNTPKNPGLL